MPSKSRVVWKPQGVIRRTTQTVERNMGDAVQLLRNETVKSINQSQPTRRSGSGRRVGLQPSAPGQPPKRVEGDLVRSITTDVRLVNGHVIGRYGSTQTEKALSLEFGTSRMAARPFLRPAYYRNRAAVRRILARRR